MKITGKIQRLTFHLIGINNKVHSVYAATLSAHLNKICLMKFVKHSLLCSHKLDLSRQAHELTLEPLKNTGGCQAQLPPLQSVECKVEGSSIHFLPLSTDRSSNMFSTLLCFFNTRRKAVVGRKSQIQFSASPVKMFSDGK